MPLTERMAQRRRKADPVRSLSEPPVAPGDVIEGKYRVESVLGAGGMGVVVGAAHLQLEQRVAIKFMSPLLRLSDVGVRRFIHEAQAAARIRCEHVVRVFDVGALADNTPYIVMEYLDGDDLEHVIARRHHLPVDEAVDYLLQACEAIAEAHVAGIVHRDLKPGNLALCRRPDGSPLIKVLDFGVSKLLLKARLTPPAGESAGILGSPHYISPEQIRSPSEVDARTDIWALGAVLYELVSGEPPFDGGTLSEICGKILNGKLAPLHPTHAEVPAELDAVIERCLQKNAGDRYPSVAHFADALSPFAHEASRLSIRRISSVVRGRPRIYAARGGIEASLLRLRSGLANTLSWPREAHDTIRESWALSRRRARQNVVGWTVTAITFAAVVVAGVALLRAEGRPNARPRVVPSGPIEPEAAAASAPPSPVPAPLVSVRAEASASGSSKPDPPKASPLPRAKPIHTGATSSAPNTSGFGGLQ